MKIPFNPGSGVRPPYLAGREEQINKFGELLESIKDGHSENALVYGLRGTGKTVLLDEFQALCIQKGFLPIRRSQFSDKYCDTRAFEEALKYDIRIAIESFSRLEKLKDNLGIAVSLFKPKSVGIPELFYYEPSYEHKRSVPFEDYLANYLEKTGQSSKKLDSQGLYYFTMSSIQL